MSKTIVTISREGVGPGKNWKVREYFTCSLIEEFRFYSEASSFVAEKGYMTGAELEAHVRAEKEQGASRCS